MADLELSTRVPGVADGGVWLTCIECGETFPPFEDVIYTCEGCGGLLEVRYDRYPTFEDFAEGGAATSGTVSRTVGGECRGVWRYAAALPFEEGVSLPEGDTPLHEVPRLEDEVGVRNLRVKHEGMNPTGSFKDRGMTVGVRVAE
ncbi:threonine synthase, partial [Halobacteriales archaeon QS_5_70_17]